MTPKQQGWMALALLLVSILPSLIAVLLGGSPATQRDAFIATLILLTASVVNVAVAAQNAHNESGE